MPYLLILEQMGARGEDASRGQDGVGGVSAPLQVRDEEDVEAGRGGVGELSEEEEALGVRQWKGEERGMAREQ